MKKISYIVIFLFAVGVGLYISRTIPKPVPNSNSNSSSDQKSGLNTYSGFGITFQYPTEWGIPKESFYGKGLGSISFDTGTSSAQSFDVMIEQDIDPEGSGTLLNETFEQMIARFKVNDKYIYDTNDILADGVSGKELCYNSAVTGKPYHLEALFPLQSGSYISFGADLDAVSSDKFDLIITSLKWDSTTAFTEDPATGMAIYSNNGIRFEYPEKFDTNYASLTINTSIEKADGSKMDANGCYSSIAENGKPSTATTSIVNGVKFCLIVSNDVGAGQLYTLYDYMTFRDGNAYTVDYSVHTSNGCSAYEESPDLTSPENQEYNECMAFKGDYNNIVIKPIQQSISTFTFTK